MKSLIKYYIGIVLGWAGVPGIVRECTYVGDATRAKVSVRIHPLFTIITVNGIDVYFTRLTGGIDGTGMNNNDQEAANQPPTSAASEGQTTTSASCPITFSATPERTEDSSEALRRGGQENG